LAQVIDSVYLAPSTRQQHLIRGMALLGRATLALLLAGGDALLAHRGQAEDLSCLCLNWADVYKADSGHNVQCGQGMELFFALDQMHLGLDNNVRNKLLLAKSSAPATMGVETLKQMGVYSEFCEGFFMKANFNYCVNKRFQMKKEEVHTSKGSWCYVSDKCKLPSATPVPGTNVAAKLCSPELDMSLSRLPMGEVVRIADEQHLDQGVMAGHAYLYKDMLVEDLDAKILNEIWDDVDGKDGTLIWSMRNHFAPRWVVKKNVIYEHRINATKRGWDVKCVGGCLSSSHNTTAMWAEQHDRELATRL